MVLNEENVKKKLDELMALRGKRGTSKKDQIAQVEPYVNLMPHTSYLIPQVEGDGHVCLRSNPT